MSTLATSSSRVRPTVAWSLQGLLAVAFLYFGVTKYTGGAEIVASYQEIGAGQWLRYLDVEGSALHLPTPAGQEPGPAVELAR